MILSQRLVPNSDRSGVHLAIETLPGSLALWNLIRENKTYQIPSLQQRGKAAGIMRLDDSLADLTRNGSIAVEDAIRAAQFPDELRRELLQRPGSALGDTPSRTEPQHETTEGGPRGFLERAGALFRRGGS